MTRLSYRKYFIPGAILLALGACANGEENVLFVTATQIDIGYDAALGNANIGYDRNEFVVGPQYVQTGGTPPIVSDMKSDLSFFNPKINQLYATGNAALVATGGSPESKIGNANDLKGERRAMFFGTSTSFGLNLKFQSEIPTAISLGYKRKELSVIPLNKSADRKADQVDKYGSTFARIEMNGDIGAPTKTSVPLKQFFATGSAAENLAANPDLKHEIAQRAINQAAVMTLGNIDAVVMCVSSGDFFGTARVIEMYMGEKNVIDVSNIEILLVQRINQERHAVVRSRVDKRRARARNARDEARRKLEIGPRYRPRGAQVPGNAMARNDRLSAQPVERRVELLPGHRLDLAFRLDLQFRADRPRDLDIEAGRAALRVGEIEGREVERREEAQSQQPGQIGTRNPVVGIGQARRIAGIGREGRQHGEDSGRDGSGKDEKAHDFA